MLTEDQTGRRIRIEAMELWLRSHSVEDAADFIICLQDAMEADIKNTNAWREEVNNLRAALEPFARFNINTLGDFAGISQDQWPTVAQVKAARKALGMKDE